MADNIKVDVKPTPVQRNAIDVAWEMTQLYFRTLSPSTRNLDKLQEIYLKCYATVEGSSHVNPTDLKEFMPEELKKIISEY